MRSRYPADELNFWPVIADAFVAILGVFVFLVLLALSDLGRGAVRVPPWVKSAEELFIKRLQDEAGKRLLRFSKESRSLRISLTEKYLEFEDCSWVVKPKVGERIRGLFRDLDKSEGSPISDIRIEGHADVQVAAQCHC